jgi:hypothetical protein
LIDSFAHRIHSLLSQTKLGLKRLTDGQMNECSTSKSVC